MAAIGGEFELQVVNEFEGPGPGFEGAADGSPEGGLFAEGFNIVAGLGDALPDEGAFVEGKAREGIIVRSGEWRGGVERERCREEQQKEHDYYGTISHFCSFNITT